MPSRMKPAKEMGISGQIPLLLPKSEGDANGVALACWLAVPALADGVLVGIIVGLEVAVGRGVAVAAGVAVAPAVTWRAAMPFMPSLVKISVIELSAMLITAISPRVFALSSHVTYRRCPSGEFAI